MSKPRADDVTNAAFDLRIDRQERVSLMPRAHRHHEVEVNFVERGEATYLIGGRLVRVPAGRFAFFWGAVPHRLMDASAATRGFWFVTIPLPWALSWGLPPRLVGRLLDGELLIDRKPRAADVGRFTEWRDVLGDARRERPALLELEARFQRFALDNPTSGAATTTTRDVAPSAAANGKVERLARFVVEHFREPITLAEIADAAGLHANYAANLFRRHCGQTLFQCVNQHRIAHAQRLLATTDAKVLDVALQSGFGSVSRFYESFVAACGQTPSAFRKRFKR